MKKSNFCPAPPPVDPALVLVQPTFPLVQPALPLVQPALPLVPPALPLVQPALPPVPPALPQVPVIASEADSTPEGSTNGPGGVLYNTGKWQLEGPAFQWSDDRPSSSGSNSSGTQRPETDSWTSGPSTSLPPLSTPLTPERASRFVITATKTITKSMRKGAHTSALVIGDSADTMSCATELSNDLAYMLMNKDLQHLIVVREVISVVSVP